MSMRVVSLRVVGSLGSGPALRLIWLATAAWTCNVMTVTAAPAQQQQTAPAAAPSATLPGAPAASGPQSFAAIVRTVKPAVISVRVKVAETSPEDLSSRGDNSDPDRRPPMFNRPPLDRFFRNFGMPGGPDGGRAKPHLALAQGSGFFISSDGYAVTNSHVVAESNSVEVQTDDDRTLKARVIGTDPKTDVALIKVEGNDFPYVAFSDAEPQVGDWVLAVGNPYGLGGSVTAGIISARGRDIGSSPYDDFLQIDAPVNKGNSGGPAFDENGKVVGVTTAIFSPSGGSVGIGFAIPAGTVRNVVTELKATGEVTRGWIGVQIQPVTEEIATSLGLAKAEGALVDEPQPDSPAVRAGIKSGDVIQSVNGEPVKDSRDLAKKIAAIAPGRTATLGIIQDGTPRTVTLQIAKMPERTAADNRQRGDNRGTPQLGLTLAPASSVAGQGTPGVMVTDVDPDGPAAERGIHAGDIILEVGGRPVNNPNEVRDRLDAARSTRRQAVLMRVKSGDTARYVAMPVAAG